MKYLAIVALFAGALAALIFLMPSTQTAEVAPVTEPGDSAIVAISLPEALTPEQVIGKTIFEAKCAICHAENAVGQDGVAPPLVHKIYEPSHHGDEAFQRAVAIGVRGHHWPFGNMPPVEGLTRADVAMVISYIRALQRENGIQ